MTTRNRLIDTVLISLTVATLGFSTGSNAAEAKILENTVESQPKAQLVAVKFKKHPSRKSFKKAKKYKKHHHGHKKFFGHKKVHFFR